MLDVLDNVALMNSRWRKSSSYLNFVSFPSFPCSIIDTKTASKVAAFSKPLGLKGLLIVSTILATASLNAALKSFALLDEKALW